MTKALGLGMLLQIHHINMEILTCFIFYCACTTDEYIYIYMYEIKIDNDNKNNDKTELVVFYRIKRPVSHTEEVHVL